VGEKPDFWPVSKFNTGSLPLRGILPVKKGKYHKSIYWNILGDPITGLCSMLAIFLAFP